MTYPYPEQDPAGPSDQSPWANSNERPDTAYGWQPPTQPGPVDSPYPPQSYPQQSYPQQPYPPQAYPQQPVPGQAPPQAYGPPAYGPPAYGPPAYGPPTYGSQSYEPQPGPDPFGAQPYLVDPNLPYSGYSAPPPKGMPTGVKILLIVLPIVVVVSIGAFLFGSHRNSGSTTALTAAGATTGATSTGGPKLTAGNDHFKLPATVAGLPPSTNPAMQDISKYMTDAIAGQLNATSVAGVYQSKTTLTNLIILIGVSSTVADPAEELSAGFSGLTDNKQYTLSKPKAYDAGPQGGVMKCTGGKLAEGAVSLPIGICVIADKGGMIMTMYFEHSAAATAKMILSARSSFEK